MLRIVNTEQRVAVIIPAMNEEDRIAATIQAAKSIPHVDLIVVVDDGSTDSTQDVARASGASVARHTVNRGKAAAMETGAAVVAMRDVPGKPPRALLFLDADLAESAVECAPLVSTIFAGGVDCAIAYLPPQAGAGGHGIVTTTGRKGITYLTGWSPQQPLSGQRCITRAAFDAITPLASGWGVEVGMTVDLLVARFTIQEVPCDLRHRVSTNDFAGQLHRAAQLRGVICALMSRILRGHRVQGGATRPVSIPGKPFNAYSA
ncbi:glycosyltransferase family 2 protein [Arcanobacterium buesumense]|uniref:Glucosyl-3-phosphoglycerate synthase n=1 Tax=Arcanobacterium buesumense TaxID=2722751 RepID=A0A6H2ENA8_9ACTO|nr:glycosyltransferase family 2 protein [Arcanobacterium buesumense]QJC22556.1 glycosyltransferase family 2 protein [Arcanobacterium buesumense]